MNLRNVIPVKTQQVVGRNALKIQKHSPHILFGVGVVGFGATVFLSAKATLKTPDIIKEHTELLETTDKAREINPDAYSEEDQKRDQVIIWSKLCVSLVKTYAPALIAGGITIAAFAGSHKILNARNASLAAAVKLGEEAFAKYRDRVVEELGEEVDAKFFHDIRSEKIKSKDEEGKQKTEEVLKTDGSASMYARFFDELNPNFDKRDHAMNRLFISTQQNYANDLLKVRGHVLLNDVYDLLGFERTKAGAVVGWVISNDGTDNHIDFGIFNSKKLEKRMFVNGDEEAVLLDFNVNGVVYDMI